MTDNATPKPLSEKPVVTDAMVERAYEWAERRVADIDPNRTSRVMLREMLEAALKAQPAPVPLAEDEALIAEGDEFNRALLRDRVQGWGVATRICERLELRSGHLAQVLALCTKADSGEVIDVPGSGYLSTSDVYAAIKEAK